MMLLQAQLSSDPGLKKVKDSPSLMIAHNMFVSLAESLVALPCNALRLRVPMPLPTRTQVRVSVSNLATHFNFPLVVKVPCLLFRYHGLKPRLILVKACAPATVACLQLLFKFRALRFQKAPHLAQNIIP